MDLLQTVRPGSQSVPSLLEVNPLLLCVFKNLELIIEDSNRLYIFKVETLLTVMENVLDYSSRIPSEQFLIVFRYLYKHMLNVILHGDWLNGKIFIYRMNTILERFQVISIKRKILTITSYVEYILELLKDPWGSTVRKILNGENCTDQELQDLVYSEINLIFKTRLKMMICGHCDSQALQLIENFIQCVHNFENNSENNQWFVKYANELTTIKDIYLLLLVKVADYEKLCHEVSKIGLFECSNLVCRCRKLGYLRSLKKSVFEMVDIVTNMVLTLAMIHPVSDEVNLECLLQEWCKLYTEDSKFLQLIKVMSLQAISSFHIYLLAKVLVHKYGNLQKSLCIELFVRAFTVSLNEMEMCKTNSEYEKLKLTEVQLASGFLFLADYLQDDIITCRECLLTSFSLHPTSTCYSKVQEIAMLSGIYGTVQNSKTIHVLKQNSNEIDLKESYGTAEVEVNNFDTCARSISQSSSVAPGDSFNFPTPIVISDAKQLGISQKLFEDLISVISSGRYKALNWTLDWTELSSRCKAYQTYEKNFRSSHKELKYINLNHDVCNNITTL